MVDIVYFFLYIFVHILSAASFVSVVFCAKRKEKKMGATSKENQETLKSCQDMKKDDQLKFDIQNEPGAPETELKSDADANLLGDKKIQSKIMPGAAKDQQGRHGTQAGACADASVIMMNPGEQPVAVKSMHCAQKKKPRYVPSSYVSK